MLRTLLTAVCVISLASLCSPGEARTLRYGSFTDCSVMSRHPCLPTACSVFDRQPCVPQWSSPIGQDLRINVESAKTYLMPDHDLNTLADLYAALRACWQ